MRYGQVQKVRSYPVKNFHLPEKISWLARIYIMSVHEMPSPYPMRRSCIHILLLSSGLACQVLAATTVQYNRDIRPIIADTCYHCHGPDSGTRKAGLRLDTEAGFFAPRVGKDGKEEPPTIVRGQPDQSPLYQRLITTDEDDIMPPKKEHKDLKPAQIALIKAWIEQGALWQPHWSFMKPERAALPEVRNQKSEVRNPIDRFVFAKLEQNGLAPTVEADRPALARRLALDLTGLPPSPEAVEAFVNDKTPDAYDKLVDQFLNSERWGEHRARYWLDAARYGDTHGMHYDNYREMWPYRDWVISAFNRNQPFDQFSIEQIAGDLLPSPTESQLIATGFQRCNITTNEGGTIDEENLMLYATDRVQTMGWVFMGLTSNCAQCHDHKFDPFTQRDFYSMAAFFRNTTQGPKDDNVKDSGPVLVIPTANDRARWTAVPKEIAATNDARIQRKEKARDEFAQWLASAKPETLNQDLPCDGLVAHVPLDEGSGNEVSGACESPKKFKATGDVTWKLDGKFGPAPVMKAGSTFELGDLGDYEKTQKFSYGAWIKAGRNGVFGGIIARMDEKNGYRGWDLFQSDTSLAVHLVDKWPDSALKMETEKPVLTTGTWQHVFVTYNGSGKPGGVKLYLNGVAQKLKAASNTLGDKSSIRTPSPLRIGQRSDTQIFDDGSIQDVRLYSRMLEADEVKKIANIAPLRAMLAAVKRTPQQQATLFEHYLATRDDKFIEFGKKIDALEAERKAIRERSPKTHIQEEVKGTRPMANILLRGQYDKKGEQVEANVPAFLNPMPEGTPRNRLGLAQWTMSPENPLTARATVNRFWQELFGTGIVKSSEDLGIMGTPPSHPELLDWLAVEFRENGWDVKKLFKLLVTSSTYRQAAINTPEKLEKDPHNKLLSRGPRFRMDAEMIRDYALAVSGTLSVKMGGPGTKPYQPEHIWDQVGLRESNTREYKQDEGENLYRRTVYSYWKRMAPPPNMDIFNAPAREASCVRRDRTNTPLQALVTMNDPQFVEAARSLAQRALLASENDETKINDYIARRVLSRPLTDTEKTILQSSLKDLSGYYQKNVEDAKKLLTVGNSKADPKLDAAQLAAWTMVCNQIMNLDEVLSK